MASSSLKFGVLASTASFERARALFSDEGTVAKYLEFEAALARAQARAGVIPASAATAIAEICRTDLIDMERLQREAAGVGYPIVALVRQLSERAGAAGGFVHWGATTQDVMDSGLMLQARDGLETTTGWLDKLVPSLRSLARSHRATVMAGRSKLQHAAPITFGLKVIGWLSQVDRARERLRATARNSLKLQFGGAVGNLSALGERGLEIRALLAEELDLPEPDATWHTARDPICDLVYALTLTNVALAKIGLDVSLLMATEVNEVREPFAAGRGTSSTMPQKRNPVMSEALVAAARMARDNCALTLDSALQDHERTTSTAQLELHTVEQAIVLAASAAELAVGMVDGLEIDAERMRTNLDLTGGQVMAEAVMMRLARQVGRSEAHHLVQTSCLRLADEDLSLKDALSQTLEGSILQDEELWQPESYLGSNEAMISGRLK